MTKNPKNIIKYDFSALNISTESLQSKCFSLQLLTDEYRDFAISMKTSGNKDIEKNVIESVQAIEDFAFKYASFNLNSSKTQERKENQHIGKKKVQSCSSQLGILHMAAHLGRVPLTLFRYFDTDHDDIVHVVVVMEDSLRVCRTTDVALTCVYRFV